MKRYTKVTHSSIQIWLQSLSFIFCWKTDIIQSCLTVGESVGSNSTFEAIWILYNINGMFLRPKSEVRFPRVYCKSWLLRPFRPYTRWNVTAHLQPSKNSGQRGHQQTTEAYTLRRCSFCIYKILRRPFFSKTWPLLKGPSWNWTQKA